MKRSDFLRSLVALSGTSLWMKRADAVIPVEPSTIPLSRLAAIRGAMWCTRLNVPFGPRPGQDDNIFFTGLITDYSPDDQKRIIAILKKRGYTHVVMGPLVDGGYHKLWPPSDWRGKNFSHFLDAVQLFWDHGLAPIVFIHPDEWSFEQTRDELTPLLSQPRAQRLLRIVVPSGWEPAGHEWSSVTWALFAQWGRTILPNALILIHTTPDADAPMGTDERYDDSKHSKAEAWARVVPYIHGWLTQSATFKHPDAHDDPDHPEKTNFENWQDRFRCSVPYSYCNRFHHGYEGWPTSSAWGTGIPIRIYAGEYAAYWETWDNRPESEAMNWGDAAIRAGADGYLDGGRLPVPVRNGP